MNDFFIMVNCTINNADITTLFALITDTLRKGITNCNDIYIFVSEKIKCTNKSFEKDIFNLVNRSEERRVGKECRYRWLWSDLRRRSVREEKKRRGTTDRIEET